MPRSEVATILGVSVRTLGRWEGPRFRIKRMKRDDGAPVVFIHRDDVERARLAKIGRQRHEIEAMVLTALARGDEPVKIVSECRVTLADIDEIQRHESRLRGSIALDGFTVRELQSLLDLAQLDPGTLVRRVREFVETSIRLAGRLADLEVGGRPGLVPERELLAAESAPAVGTL